MEDTNQGLSKTNTEPEQKSRWKGFFDKFKRGGKATPTEPSTPEVTQPQDFEPAFGILRKIGYPTIDSLKEIFDGSQRTKAKGGLFGNETVPASNFLFRSKPEKVFKNGAEWTFTNAISINRRVENPEERAFFYVQRNLSKPGVADGTPMGTPESHKRVTVLAGTFDSKPAGQTLLRFLFEGNRTDPPKSVYVEISQAGLTVKDQSEYIVPIGSWTKDRRLAELAKWGINNPQLSTQQEEQMKNARETLRAEWGITEDVYGKPINVEGTLKSFMETEEPVPFSAEMVKFK